MSRARSLGRQAAKLLIALRARPRVARRSCRCQSSKRSCARPRSRRFISSQRSAPRAICCWRSGSSSVHVLLVRREQSPLRLAQAPPTRCLARVPRPPASASNAMHIATSLFAFIFVIPRRRPRTLQRSSSWLAAALSFSHSSIASHSSSSSAQAPRYSRKSRSGPGSACRLGLLRAARPQASSSRARAARQRYTAHQPTLSSAPANSGCSSSQP